jgi:transcriptional regulator with XRE-family HTH domain
MVMIGERMKELRKKLDLTLEALAEKCGVSTNTVWRWEQDKQIPMIDMLERLADALNTTTKYLLGKTNDPTLGPVTMFDNSSHSAVHPFPKQLRQEAITANDRIVLAVRDLPPFIEGENPNLADFTTHFVTIPLMWVGKIPDSSRPFFFTVRGDAMAGAGLHDGFLALVNPDEPFSNGDIHLLVVRTKRKNVYEIVVRWTYVLPDGSIELRCPNPDYPVYRFQADPPGCTPDDDVVGVGKIVGAWAGTLKHGK